MRQGWSTWLLGAIVAILFGVGLFGPTPEPKPTPPWPRTGGAPAVGSEIRAESRVLSGTLPVPLLHAVMAVRYVYGFTPDGRRVDYARGRDWEADGRSIRRTVGSRIPDFGDYRYRAQKGGSRFTFAPQPRNPPRTGRFDIYIDYLSPIPERIVRARPLPHPVRKVLCLGDSITAGADTVADTAFDSHEEGWCGLLRRYLGGRATVVTSSAPGGVLHNVWQYLPFHLASEPDTVIVAFGMNDHVAGGIELPAFASQIDSVLSRLKAGNRNVLAVGFFQQNPLFALEDPERTRAFNAAIREAARKNGIPFVDPYAAFDRAKPGPSQYFHLTADFMHHPNSYGQRIYFSLMVPYFLRRDTAASAIDGYVVGDW